MRTKAEAKLRPAEGDTWKDKRGLVYAIKWCVDGDTHLTLWLESKTARPVSNIRYMSKRSFWKWAGGCEFLGGKDE